MSTKLSAAEKAAVVLLTLGEDLASEIVRQMPAAEVRRVALAMGQLGRVGEEVAAAVAAEFQASLERKPTLTGDGQAAQRMLRLAGHGDAADALDGTVDLATPQLTELLNTMDATTLASSLSREQTQTVAVVLAHCPAKLAGETLKLLPAVAHGDILQRLAHLGPIDAESLEAIFTTLQSEREQAGSRRTRAVGGVDKLVALIGGMEQAAGERLLADLDLRDAELAAEVRRRLFTFGDLVRITDRGMQVLLAQVPAATLRLALKGAAEAVRTHIYKNLSQRAAQLLKDDVEALPKTRLSDVAAAQQQLAELALKLATAGKLEIPSGSEIYV